ncbi:hypothetical protein [Lysinibacillus endophyticus]|uniref:Uncharacterized protein n=1 Tax=Ureibacillus endophyticus TaxID=1978490 RepID=A0A494YTP6_9BACL|nr:hypothetical protein [Lysinibacillus endophyticus]MCP1145663.1 hypothetical protein [Lysinibacillus endophyticus]RKQ13512.1 hypothetical protein D8M03_16035 [Lysinibacillus endophyticus]
MDKLLLFSFLSFPEDKSTYIPAVIELIIVVALCGLALMAIKRLSKKQELKTKELEERILRERQQNAQNQ